MPTYTLVISKTVMASKSLPNILADSQTPPVNL